MGTVSQRWFETMPAKQKESFLYYKDISRGKFRNILTDEEGIVYLADVKCSSVEIFNSSGKTINVWRGAYVIEGISIQIPNLQRTRFDVTDTAQELGVTNGTDSSPASVQYRCFGEQI